VDIPVSPSSIKDDITETIENKVDTCPYLVKRSKSSPKTRRFIVESLRNGAQGMFLLPRLMIEELASRTTAGEIYAFLGDLPVDLCCTYGTDRQNERVA
jgi:hypothetical protein